MWIVRKAGAWALHIVGRAVQTLAVSILVLSTLIGGFASANYFASPPGSGTAFGSIVVSTVHYVQMLICDPVTPANCGSVKAGNSAGTTDVAQVVADANALAALQAAWPAGTNMGGYVGLQANTTGGCTPARYLSAASTNSTSVKGSAGTLCSITVIQNTATAADLRLYDSASAPTCSSATGVVANYGIQANTTSSGISPNLGPFGLNFTTGIGFCLTAYDGTDTNNSNATTGLQIVLGYK